ncbi:MAG: hypothetical protein JO026_03250, partial [Patescibacteria group bacterium]|nr:hypothetical protein [Patescibacteria group bacterium]
YKYARDFLRAEIIRKYQKHQFQEEVRRQLREQLLEKLGWGWHSFEGASNDANVYDSIHSKEPVPASSVKNVQIKIVGTASGEGPEYKGSSTILPGHIDPENVSLAKRRAQDISPTVKQVLKEFGMRFDGKTAVLGKELEFSNEEIEEMARAAKKIPGIYPVENETTAAFLLIREYNAGNVRDSKTKTLLDKIVAEKRGVEITVTYDNTKKEKKIYPLPFAILALGLIRYLPRQKIRERFGPSVDLPNREFSEIWKEASKVGVREAGRMSERFIIDELNPYLGTKQDDIGYMDTVIKGVQEGKASKAFAEVEKRRTEKEAELLALKEQSASEISGPAMKARSPLSDIENYIHAPIDDLEKELSLDLLYRWQKRDQEVRADHKDLVPGEEAYWRDASKVAWAKEASRWLIHFMQVYSESAGPAGEDAVYADLARTIRKMQAQKRFVPDVPERKNIRSSIVPKEKKERYKRRKKIKP